MHLTGGSVPLAASGVKGNSHGGVRFSGMHYRVDSARGRALRCSPHPCARGAEERSPPMATTTRITEQYVAANPKSRALHERARKSLPGGIAHDVRNIHPFPLTMSHAEGAYKWDVDGHRYIDYVVGHGALLLGHSHPEIVAAVQQQVARGTHLGAGNAYEIEWAELVQRLVPSADLVKFTSSGTEATMMAMRLARAYTGRDKVLKFAGHFHGWHDYATVAQQLPYDGTASPGVPAGTL